MKHHVRVCFSLEEGAVAVARAVTMKTTTTTTTTTRRRRGGVLSKEIREYPFSSSDLIALLEKVRAQPVGGEVRFAMQPAKARRGLCFFEVESEGAFDRLRRSLHGTKWISGRRILVQLARKSTYKIKAPRGKGYVFVDSKPRPWDGALDESSESKHCAKRARRMMVDENGEAEYEEEEWDDDDDELWS
eukprot:g697.t1